MPTYAANSAKVSSERLGDEIIVIDAASGAYYSGSGTTADAWSLLTSGAQAEVMITRLAALYGAREEQVRDDLIPMLEFLLARELIIETQPSPDSLELPDIARGDWTAPKLEEYTDMWDLLKADPIHDVGEAGWPYAMPTSKE